MNCMYVYVYMYVYEYMIVIFGQKYCLDLRIISYMVGTSRDSIIALHLI